jgi:hypothetical protein
VKSKFTKSSGLLVLTIVTFSLAVGCGGSVKGNTYADNGGVVQIEFKSGDKAYLSMGPTTSTCSYSESGKKVTLTCEGDKTVFTIDDDGALNGPPGGLVSRLTKKK